MALQLDLKVSDVGYEFPECYARIVFARTMKDQTLIWVNFYANYAARVAEDMPVKQKEYPCVTAELQGDIFPAMYAYLKTLPDFAGAIDVLSDPAQIETV
jgi:hypothetical protein